MERTHAQRCLDHGIRFASLLKRLSLEAESPSVAAYWLSLFKAATAGVTALDALIERTPGRAVAVDAALTGSNVSDALAALLEATDVLASQFPYLMHEQARFEVDRPAFERRGRRRVSVTRL